MAKQNLKKDRTLEIITHVIGIFSGIFGALLIFLLSKDNGVKKHSRNALNWQISLLFYFILIFILSLIVAMIRSFFMGEEIFVSFSLLISVFTILNIIFCVVAAFKAFDGILWKYPMSFNFIGKINEKEIEKSKKEIRKTIKKVRQEFKR